MPGTNNERSEDTKVPRRTRGRTARKTNVRPPPDLCDDVQLNKHFAALLKKMKERYLLELEVEKLEKVVKTLNKKITTLDTEIVTMFKPMDPFLIENQVKGSRELL